MAAPSTDPEGPAGRSSPTDPTQVVRQSLINGVAIALPLLVTFVVLGFVLNFVSNTLSPISSPIANQVTIPGAPTEAVVQAVTLLFLLVAIFVVGFVSEYKSGEEKVGEGFDAFMESIPGIGSVYTSFNEMSELLLDSDTESFQEVKLVQYPTEGSYVVAFKTAETPSPVEEGAGHEDMVTLFMPMAPNPVMGGFVIHVDKSRVVDVDITVEQGIRSIVTSGVAIGEDDPRLKGLTRSEMRELGQIERIDQQIDPGQEFRGLNGVATESGQNRTAQYNDAVSPEHSDTPDKIAARARAHDDREETTIPPAELAGRDPETAAATESTPAEMPDHDERMREPTRGTPAEGDRSSRRTPDDEASGGGNDETDVTGDAIWATDDFGGDGTDASDGGDEARSDDAGNGENRN